MSSWISISVTIFYKHICLVHLSVNKTYKLIYNFRYLRQRLLCHESLNRGWVLDGFPTSLAQCIAGKQSLW